MHSLLVSNGMEVDGGRFFTHACDDFAQVPAPSLDPISDLFLLSNNGIDISFSPPTELKIGHLSRGFPLRWLHVWLINNNLE